MNEISEAPKKKSLYLRCLPLPSHLARDDEEMPPRPARAGAEGEGGGRDGRQAGGSGRGGAHRWGMARDQNSTDGPSPAQGSNFLRGVVWCLRWGGMVLTAHPRSPGGWVRQQAGGYGVWSRGGLREDHTIPRKKSEPCCVFY